MDWREKKKKKKKEHDKGHDRSDPSLSEGETNTGNSLIVNHFAKTNCSILYRRLQKGNSTSDFFLIFKRRGAVL